MKRLGVNIDHVATLRNARGEIHPSPLIAAKYALKSGANSITVHLREDRRHINDSDLIKICKDKKIPINLEMALDDQILKLALKNKPNFVCIVPENRKEITTEGGLNLVKNIYKIKKIISKLKKVKIRSSLFVNPNIKDIILAKKLNSDCVGLHTGKLSNMVKLKRNYQHELKKIKKSSIIAKSIGLEVHVGHGIDLKTAKILNTIKEITEFNIGHFIIGESIFYGLAPVIKKFRKILNS